MTVHIKYTYQNTNHLTPTTYAFPQETQQTQTMPPNTMLNDTSHIF